MKKTIKIIPALFVSIGLLMMLCSAGSSDYAIEIGERAPQWTAYGCWAGLALFSIGCAWSRIFNDIKNTRRYK